MTAFWREFRDEVLATASVRTAMRLVMSAVAIGFLLNSYNQGDGSLVIGLLLMFALAWRGADFRPREV